MRRLTLRWLLSAHPLPPLLLLPPISLTLTISSSFFAFLIISYIFRGKTEPTREKDITAKSHTSEQALLEEKRRTTFETRDAEERREEERRRREWEQVESSALGGLQRMPEGRKRESTIGGVSHGRVMTVLLILSLRRPRHRGSLQALDLYWRVTIRAASPKLAVDPKGRVRIARVGKRPSRGSGRQW